MSAATSIALVALHLAQAGTAPPPAEPIAAPAGVLVVLNKSAATATFVDAGTGETLRTLPTGEGPHEAAVSPDGRYAVVANYGAAEPGGTLSVFDLARGTALEPIDLGGLKRPHGLAFAGGLLLVTAEAQRTLAAVDVAARKVVRTCETGQDVSHMVAVAPDGKRAFVANIGSGTVTAVDLASFEVVKSVATGAQAEGIDVRPDGLEVWVTNRAADTISVLDAATLEEKALIPCAGFPIRVTFTPDGRLALVSCPSAGVVRAFDARTREEEGAIAIDLDLADGAEEGLFGARFGRSAVPIGILVPPGGGKAYVACSAADRVAVIDLATLALERSFAVGREPDGLAWYAP